jgi:hypothetical protein
VRGKFLYLATRKQLHCDKNNDIANLGGRQHSREDLDKMRQEQERKQQMEAKFDKVRQRVSASLAVCMYNQYLFYVSKTIVCVCVCVQEKREEYRRQQREKEDEKLHKMKQTQREKVANLLISALYYINWSLYCCYRCCRRRDRKLGMKDCAILSRKR